MWNDRFRRYRADRGFRAADRKTRQGRRAGGLQRRGAWSLHDHEGSGESGPVEICLSLIAAPQIVTAIAMRRRGRRRRMRRSSFCSLEMQMTVSLIDHIPEALK